MTDSGNILEILILQILCQIYFSLRFMYLQRSVGMTYMYSNITQYGSTVYIGIAMVFVFSPYIREIQFLLSVSSKFDF